MTDQKEFILKKSGEMFMRLGLKSVTMDDLSKEMGISKKTLYKYVDNKSDLIRQIVDRYVDTETTCISGISGMRLNPVEEMFEIGKYASEQMRDASPAVIYDLKKYYPEHWKKFISVHNSQIYELIRSNMKRGMESEVYRSGIDPDILARIYVGSAFLLVNEELFPNKNYARGTLLNQFLLYHLNGIVSDKGRKLMETSIKMNIA